MSWFADWEPVCRADVPLAQYTWYRLGGPARWLLTPADEAQLAALVTRCRECGISWRVLGRGANVLVSDRGFDGAVIRLTGPHFERVRAAGRDQPQADWSAGVALAAATMTLHVGAGADFTRLAKQTSERGLSGLENLAGIPGTLGGLVRMNAGGKYGAIGQYVRRARVLEPDGRIQDRTAAQLGFAYRHTELDGCIVLGAELELRPADPRETKARFREIWNEKYATQPPVSQRSAGCIFKNPPADQSTLSAGALIDRCGLRGRRIGGAEISPRHANFIVAHEGATAADVLALIEEAQRMVAERFGVHLQREVEVW